MEHGSPIVQIVILAVLLLFSAFFSGSETAFFSLNSLEKHSLRRRCTGKKGQFVQLLFSQPDEVLVTILTGNMFVNIFASSIAEALGARIFAEAAELLSITLMTLLLLIVGEMTPKNLAIRHSLRTAMASATFLRLIHTALRPLSYPLGRLRHSVLSAVPRSRGDVQADQAAAVLSAIRMGYQSKTIEETELRLLERFFRFRQKTAADVMVPRVDLRPRAGHEGVSEFMEELRSGRIRETDGVTSPATSARAESAQSLFPIYRDDVDHLTGYVRRVDLVEQRFNPQRKRLSDLARPIHAVPASKNLRELLEEMSQIGSELAVVVDEYGGTEGVVSFPGIVAYLFEDFHPEGVRDIEQREDGSYRVAGNADVEEVEAILNVVINSSSRTIAGMILDLVGEFPEVGSQVSEAGYVFSVSDIKDHRISWVDVTRENA